MTDLSIFIAFAAGLLSFLSPCVLPLVPSYISFIGGATVREADDDRTARRRIFRRTIFFVAGFSAVFVILGLVFSGPALLLSGGLMWINLAAGTVVVLLGLNMLFDVVKVLNYERRIHLASGPRSALEAALAGAAFGAGWSPCIGPILASILFLAGSEGNLGRAAVLLAVYSIGLGVPFVVSGAAFSRIQRLLARLRPIMGRIRVASGLFLIAVGLLIAFGRLQQLNGWLTSAGLGVSRWSASNPVAANIAFGGGALLIAASIIFTRLLRRRNLARPAPIALVVVLTGLGVAQFAGLWNLGELLARWLMFQGI